MEPERQTEDLEVRVFSDVLERVREAAALHGLSKPDAVGQALALWAGVAESGMIGDSRTIYVANEVAIERRRMRQFIARIFRRPASELVIRLKLTPPGDSLDDTIHRLLSDEKPD